MQEPSQQEIRKENNLIIGAHHINRNSTHHLLIIDHEQIVKLTPIEYCLIEIFTIDCIYNDTLLSKKALHANIADKATKEALRKHIGNIRSKIRPLGLDILRVQKHGYILATTSGK